MDRRRFMQVVSAGAVGAALGHPTPAFAARSGRVAPSNQVRLAVIGVGSQGKAVMRELLRVPRVSVAALCDVYAPRFAEGRQVTGGDTPAYLNWRHAVPDRPVGGRSAAEMERLINWRLHREFSRGLLAELGSHQIDFANWIFGALPSAPATR